MNARIAPVHIFDAAFSLVAEFDRRRLGRLVVHPETFMDDDDTAVLLGTVFAGTHETRPLAPSALTGRAKESLHGLLTPHQSGSDKSRSRQQALEREAEALVDFDKAVLVARPAHANAKRAAVYMAEMVNDHKNKANGYRKNTHRVIRQSAWPKGVIAHQKKQGAASKVIVDFNFNNLPHSLTYQSGGANAQNRFIADILTLASEDMRFCVAMIDSKPQIVHDLTKLKLR
ncbi:MAG: hypothetical protein V4621_06345 [Pseudomonadota bacterium]